MVMLEKTIVGVDKIVAHHKTTKFNMDLYALSITYKINLHTKIGKVVSRIY